MNTLSTSSQTTCLVRIIVRIPNRKSGLTKHSNTMLKKATLTFPHDAKALLRSD